MRIDNRQGPNKRFAPRIILCVLGLLTAIIFILPSVVSAQIIGELSQDCDTALIGTEHTITAEVTEDGAPGASASVYFYSTDSANYGKYFQVIDFTQYPNGIVPFTYQVDSVGQVEITLFFVDSNYASVPLDVITTNWTDDEANLCSESPGVTVGSRVTLNAKKRGALRIAVCASDDLDASTVDPQTVELAGVAPWRSKQKDSSLCPNGKDGVVDLVLKFKNREVVEALEDSVGELEDGQEVELALTGSLNDGTTIGGVWNAVIKKKGRRHWKEDHNKKIKEKSSKKKDKNK